MRVRALPRWRPPPLVERVRVRVRARVRVSQAGVSVPYGLLPGSQGECWSFGGVGACAEGSGGPDSDPDPSREEGLGVGHGFELWHETMVGSRVRGGRGGGLGMTES